MFSTRPICDSKARVMRVQGRFGSKNHLAGPVHEQVNHRLGLRGSGRPGIQPDDVLVRRDLPNRCQRAALDA